MCIERLHPEIGLHKHKVVSYSSPKILLPSAVHLVERLTVSQSVSQSGKQSDSQSGKQAERNTQFGVFQWKTRLQAGGREEAVRTSNGRMAMQATPIMEVGGSFPGRRSAGGAD